MQYVGWGEEWPLGMLADNRRTILFEYSKEALAQKLELSPLNFALRTQAYGNFPGHQDHLPGLIADSLPDGWGRLLMDKSFRKKGLNPAELSPLDRLAFIGSRGMGALSFMPPNMPELPDRDLDLMALAKDAQKIVEGGEGKALLELARLGGSPQGARPKVLVYYSMAERTLSTRPRPDHKPWLIKFKAANEHKEVCAIEAWYAALARACNIEMSVTRYFELGLKFAAFGTERFDVEGDNRVPVQTLAAIFNADFRIPSVLDYGKFLRVTSFLTGDEREVHKAFKRAVFNVVFHNRDDHSKNLSFRLGQDRRWRLAPAYDLTFSNGPRGEHYLDVCGEGKHITRANLLNLARQSSLSEAWAGTVIDQLLEVAASAKTSAADFAIRKSTAETIVKELGKGIGRLR